MLWDEHKTDVVKTVRCLLGFLSRVPVDVKTSFCKGL